MATRLARLACCLCMMAASPAIACSVVVQWRLPFDPGTTETSARHVAELAFWLGEAARGRLRFDAVLVEGFAPATAHNARDLADRRARKVRRMVRAFTGSALPVEIHASVVPGSSPDGSDDAVIQLAPSATTAAAGCPGPN